MPFLKTSGNTFLSINYLKEILDGTSLPDNVVLGSNSTVIDAGDFAAGKTAILGGVKGDVDNSGTLTLTGEGAANNVLVQGGVINDGTLNFQNGCITSGLIHSGTVIITGNAILNVDFTNTSNTNVQNTTFTAMGNTTLGGGTLRITNAHLDNNIANASAAFLHNLSSGIDGYIITEQNFYTVLGVGDRAYAENLFIQSGYAWGTGVTVALFIATPQTLASGGSIMVDGSKAGLTAVSARGAMHAVTAAVNIHDKENGLNAGDLQAKSSASMSGVNATIEKETTNVDGFAFNGGVGFDLAHADNGVSVGLNYTLQASEHETGIC